MVALGKVDLKTPYLDVNFEKQNRLVIGSEGANITVDPHIIKNCVFFEYLGVTLSKDGRR